MKAAARRRMLGLVTAVALLGIPTVCGAGGTDSDSKLKILGFSDFNFVNEDLAGGGTDSGFDQGQFVLHFGSALQRRLSFFAELSVTATDTETKTGLERTVLRYEFNDRAKLSGGRYHTPINWWNTAFHHGLWLQTTVDRPEMIRFGSEFMPVHFEGLLFEGTTAVKSTSFSYQVGLGDGRDDKEFGATAGSDVNNHQATLGQFSFRPDRFYELEVGGSMYLDKISTDPDGRMVSTDFDETILAAHLAWTQETPEIIAEFAQVEHDDGARGRTHTSDAYYLQVAYRLPVWKARLKPYARYEEIDIDRDDPLFDSIKSRERMLVGVRFDFSELSAIKFEVRRDRFEVQESLDAALAQVSLAF